MLWPTRQEKLSTVFYAEEIFESEMEKGAATHKEQPPRDKDDEELATSSQPLSLETDPQSKMTIASSTPTFSFK